MPWQFWYCHVMPVSIPARASVSWLRGAFIAEAVASLYKKGRCIRVRGEVRTEISSWDYHSWWNRCLNKTVFLTVVLWWFFKGWQSFIRCIEHCTLPDIFHVAFRKLALRPCSGNWLPLYWQKNFFFFTLLLVTTVWMQSRTVSGLPCAPANTLGRIKKDRPPPPPSLTTDSHLLENGVEPSPETSCILMRRS